MVRDFIRAATRPVVTVIAMSVIAHVITQQMKIPTEQWVLLVGIVTWWFGDRTVHRAKGE